MCLFKLSFLNIVELNHFQCIIQFQSTNGALKTINSSRLTVDPEGYLWYSNVTRRDASDEFLYACSAASFFRNEYKLGNRVFLQVNKTNDIEIESPPIYGAISFEIT